MVSILALSAMLRDASSPKVGALGSPRRLHLSAKASPFGRGVTVGDGEGEPAKEKASATKSLILKFRSDGCRCFFVLLSFAVCLRHNAVQHSLQRLPVFQGAAGQGVSVQPCVRDAAGHAVLIAEQVQRGVLN